MSPTHTMYSCSTPSGITTRMFYILANRACKGAFYNTSRTAVLGTLRASVLFRKLLN